MGKTWFLTMVGLALLQFNVVAQERISKCGTETGIQKILENDPSFQSVIDRSNQFIKQNLETKPFAFAKTTAQVTVPVVFHIVLAQDRIDFLGGPSRIKTLVDSQMAVINRDFNKLNTDQDFVPPAFQSIQGNAEIKFVLANRKPDGSPTDGFEIVVTDSADFIAQGGNIGSQQLCSDAKYNTTGGADAWFHDPNRISYLNVWVVKFQEGDILGIACPPEFAGGNIPYRETGVCLNYRAFGKGGASTLFITGARGGRTLSHELGHYFSIRHIWGDSNGCGQDDLIGDTPLQDDAHYGCPSFPQVSCSNGPAGDMYMNFMDYVYDDCYSMFTQEQCNVMRATLINGAANDLLDYLYLTTDVSDVEQHQHFSVYPNPATSSIFIQSNRTQGINSISVVDITGRQVRAINSSNTAITDYNLDVSGLPRGIYLLQCTFANGTATKKIVLQ